MESKDLPIKDCREMIFSNSVCSCAYSLENPNKKVKKIFFMRAIRKSVNFRNTNKNIFLYGFIRQDQMFFSQHERINWKELFPTHKHNKANPLHRAKQNE